MQHSCCQMAVVTTPDDVVLGILTIEDIVEELLGDIDEPGEETHHS